jgi:hypothetical protein
MNRSESLQDPMEAIEPLFTTCALLTNSVAKSFRSSMREKENSVRDRLSSTSCITGNDKGLAIQGSGLRGGNWNNNSTNARLSDRNNATNTNSNRNNNYDGRGVRVAP